jgi:hypothetical protein
VTNKIAKIPFLWHLNKAEGGAKFQQFGPAIIDAKESARVNRIRWVVVWHKQTVAARHTLIKFLYHTGFTPVYRKNKAGFGVSVWERTN